VSKLFSSVTLVALTLATTLLCSAAHAAQQDANAMQPQVSATQNLPSAPALQQAHGLTRAQVYAQLVQLEQVGYNPNGSHFTYPAKTQAAEARLAASTDNAGDANSAASP
jgi:glucose/arabinose dehydrogenase